MTTCTGLQLHYLTPAQESSRPNLIVFLHGFPDSCHLWTNLFRSSLTRYAHMVSLDLPGFGGSDSLLQYCPDNVLSPVHEAIMTLKRTYGVGATNASNQQVGQCIVVGHDWGGVIAARIAAGTEGLIDHVVLVNSLFVSCSLTDTLRRLLTDGNSPPIVGP